MDWSRYNHPITNRLLTGIKMSELVEYMEALGKRAKNAARIIAKADTGIKNRALESIADALEAEQFTRTALMLHF
jgi:biopolymer transport protein ExbD